MKNLTMNSKSVSKATVRRMIEEIRLANAELKSFGVAQTGIAPTTAGATFALTQGISLGDASSQRDGNQVVMQEIHFRMNFSALVNASLRYVVYQDHMNLGAVPATTDVLRFANCFSSYSNIILNEQGRFKVLIDNTIDLSVAGDTNITHINSTKKFTKKVTYLGDTDVAVSNGRNSVFVLIIGTVITAAYTYDFQVRFLDQ